MEKATNLINWVEVSRLLANNDTSVSRNRCPKKYQSKVNDLLDTVKTWTLADKPTVDVEVNSEVE